MKRLSWNKARKNYGLVSLLFFLLAVGLNAQDIIIKKNGEQLKVKIIEIGKTDITFKYFESEDGPAITMSKDEIKTYKLKSKTGYITTNLVEDPMAVSNNNIQDKTSSLKFEFFSPLQQNVAFSYEWMFKPGFNFEVGMGIIGPGVSSGQRNRLVFKEEDVHPSGFFAKLGAKFFLGSTSDFVVEGIKYAHPLKGRYIRPEIAYSNFKRTSKVSELDPFTLAFGSPVDLTRNYESIALNVIYGRQIILGNSITAGYYVGAGYGFEHPTSNIEVSPYWNTQRYAYRLFSKNLPFTYVFGFNLGFILKAPKAFTKGIDKKPDNKYNINKDNVEQIKKKID